jgi:hypothetical protein
MTYPPKVEVEFDGKRPCLHAKIRASELTSAEAFRVLGDVMNEAAERHCRDILIECDIVVPKVHESLRRAIESLSSMRFPGRVAFVNCDGPGPAGSALDGNVRLFDDRSEAEAWVLAG